MASRSSAFPSYDAFLKRLIPLLQKLPPRPQRHRARHVDDAAVEALEAMLQHRAVLLLEDIEPDLHLEVGSHTEHVAVERGVVKGAQGEAVRHDRRAARMTVGENVRGVDRSHIASGRRAAP